METELQKELREYGNKILACGVSNLLISRFERTAIKRYEEMKIERVETREENKIQEKVKKVVQKDYEFTPFVKEPNSEVSDE